jgi:hypothetical protein
VLVDKTRQEVFLYNGLMGDGSFFETACRKCSIAGLLNELEDA